MNHPIPQRTLVVQPDDGVDPVLGLLADATESLRVKQFTLSEPRLVQGLIDAHRRGVAVRVMLNPQRSSGDRPNDAVFGQLQQTGMAVQWTSPDYVVTHEKSIVVDDRHLQPMAVALAAAAFVGMAILRWPLWLVLAGLAPIGMAWYWPRERKNHEEEP
jgi:phosphatidylserine/phosphatidylglycerophosphate/cardiolipin synthase-like enzyme